MTSQQAFLLEHNNQIIKLGKVSYKVKTTANQAIYPYKHLSVRTVLEPVNKKSADYLHTKSQLKDDWYISFDQSDDELQLSVLHALGYSFDRFLTDKIPA